MESKFRSSIHPVPALEISQGIGPLRSVSFSSINAQFIATTGSECIQLIDCRRQL